MLRNTTSLSLETLEVRAFGASIARQTTEKTIGICVIMSAFGAKQTTIVVCHVPKSATPSGSAGELGVA